jgi:hypothetical protein
MAILSKLNFSSNYLFHQYVDMRKWLDKIAELFSYQRGLKVHSCHTQFKMIYRRLEMKSAAFCVTLLISSVSFIKIQNWMVGQTFWIDFWSRRSKIRGKS